MTPIGLPRIKQVAASYGEMNAALATDGTVWTWGCNNNGTNGCVSVDPAFVDTTFIDIRPPHLQIDRLTCRAGSVLELARPALDVRLNRSALTLSKVVGHTLAAFGVTLENLKPQLAKLG